MEAASNMYKNLLENTEHRLELAQIALDSEITDRKATWEALIEACGGDCFKACSLFKRHSPKHQANQETVVYVPQ